MTQRDNAGATRRVFLRLGASGLIGGLAGCSWSSRPDLERTETGTPIPYSDEYGSVIDIVADAGADPTGEESVVPVLDRVAGDDTLLYFPPGRYLVDGIWEYPAFTNLGFVGRDATIVPPEGYTGYMFVLGLPRTGASGLRFENFEFDFRMPKTHPRPIQVQADDGILIRDVAVTGTSGTARFDVTEPTGSGVVERLGLPDGGSEPNPVGCLVGPENEGTLTVRDCHIAGFPGNGLYASPSIGRVDVIGGKYENSGIANVRVSGPSTVRNVHVRCDRSPAAFQNMRGIRLRHGDSPRVENCNVEMVDVTYSGGALVLEPLVESAVLRNNRIVTRADGVPAINAKTGQEVSGNSSFECSDTTITGSASDGDAIRIVDRDGCTLSNVNVEQSGKNRNGLHLIRSTDTVLRNTEIDVTGKPFVLEDSRLQDATISASTPPQSVVTE